MKKKIFGGILVLALLAAFNINLNLDNNKFSLLSLANVEALAQEFEGEKIASTQKVDTYTYIEVEERSWIAMAYVKVKKTVYYDEDCCKPDDNPYNGCSAKVDCD